MRPTLPALIAVLAGTALLAGCSDDPQESTGAPTTAEPPTQQSEPPRVQDAVGATEALDLGACDVAAGTQTVTGVLTGAAPKADYLVVITWATDEGAVKGRGYTIVRDLPAKEKADLEITGTVAEGATTCIPAVVRGTIKGS